MTVTKFTPYVPQGPQSSALPLTARIGQLGALNPGGWVSYTVMLRNRSDKPFSFGRSCPPYEEGFFGLRPLAYVLNCHAVGSIAPHGAVSFRMLIHVPQHGSSNLLTWNLAPHSFGGGVNASCTPDGRRLGACR